MEDYGVFGLVYILVCIVTLVVGSLFSNLQFEIDIKFDNKENYASFIVRLFRGLVIRHRFNFTLSVPDKKDAASLIIRKTNAKLERRAMIGDIVQFLNNYYTANIKYVAQIRYLISKITIKKIYLHMTIGLNNAAQTALVSGLTLTLFTSLNGFLKSNLKVINSDIILIPYYEGKKFNMELNCIINVKLGYIIITKIRMLMYNLKGGEISGRTSN